MIEVAGHNEEWTNEKKSPTRSVSPPPPPPPPLTTAVDPLNSAAITAAAAIPTQTTASRLTRDIPSVLPLLVLSASHRRRRPVFERPTTISKPASTTTNCKVLQQPKTKTAHAIVTITKHPHQQSTTISPSFSSNSTLPPKKSKMTTTMTTSANSKN